MDAITELVRQIDEQPDAFCAPRSADDYGKLLNLYERVGFGPPASVQRGHWRAQSAGSWSHLDALLPASTTVGVHEGELISSFGTLPLTANLLYTHSACMLKTLPGAITLMAQAILSVTWFERLPEMNYLGIGYSYSSRFTTRFQRPLGFTIPHQIETESLLCIPEHDSRRALATQVSMIDVDSELEAMLTETHRWIFHSFSRPYPGLESLHSVRKLSIWGEFDQRPLALILLNDGPEFLTAVNVHREALVFPVNDLADIGQLCKAMRDIDDLRQRALYFFLTPGASPPSKIEGEIVEPSFWVATERSQAPLLRRSYIEAFTPLLRKYSPDEVSNYLCFRGGWRT